jgi:hypothetical protein
MSYLKITCAEQKYSYLKRRFVIFSIGFGEKIARQEVN